MRFGIDRVIEEPALLGGHRALGLVTNHAARLARTPTHPSRLALLEAGVPLVRLFGPEHGLSAMAADGEAVADGIDALTGLPVVSLYGQHMRPTAAHLAGLDAVLFDIPDVGARFYTYTWTLWHVMHACNDVGIPVYVLDRPNPLGGDLASVEGPMLEPAYRSFIGEDVIPIRHALTLGELARWWQQTRLPRLALHVITMDGWDGRPAWPALDVPWIPTSPAMPDFTSAMWYPGLCLFEATNLSAGRGTDTPFAWIGAPWLDAAAVCDRLSEIVLPAVHFEAAAFTPDMAPHQGMSCAAIRLRCAPSPAATSRAEHAHVVRSMIRPVRTALHLLRAIRLEHGKDFGWARYPTAANPSGADHWSRLIGSAQIAPLLTLADTDEFDAQITRWVDAPRHDGWGRDALHY